MEAVIVRAKLLPNKYTSMPVRIIRSHSGPVTVPEHSGRAEGVWVGKVKYWITLPQRTVSLGSIIRINIRIKPLLQGIKVREIQYRLMEMYELQISTATHEACKEVAQWRFEGHKNLVNDYEPSCYEFSGALSLPKALSKCAQDVSVRGVQVRHLFSIAIEVQDQEDQVSKVHITLPVILLVSPDTVVDCMGKIVGSSQNEVGDILTTIHDHTELGPPPYEEHVMDQSVR
jgi:hypothetical protein